MGRFSLSSEAEADLIRIHQWGLQRYGEAQADKYIFQLFDCFERLARQPLLYPSVDNIRKGYRRCLCGRDSIYFRIAEEDVEIMAIIGQQDRESWLK